MSPGSGVSDVRAQRRVLIGLALLFFAPLAFAFVLYYGFAWRPGARVNHGDLIDPPRPLIAPAMPRVAAGGAEVQGFSGPDLLKHKWTLLYVGSGACPTRCRTNLYNTRQVRTALGHDMDRVQRVFIADGPCCDLDFVGAQNRDLITVRATPETASLLEQLRNGDDPATSDRVYLIDPLGNLMMSYAPEAQPKGMLQDLKRLLGLSSVG